MAYVKNMVLKLVMTSCLLFNSGLLFAQLPEVVINEFLASNKTINQDPDFTSFSDWIELYNTTSVEINISGYFLTDDLKNSSKWQFPANTIIPANDFLIVWADGKDVNLHTNFKIGKGGEELGLSNQDTIRVDSIRFGAQQDDISYGRMPDDLTTWKYFSPPTAGSENNTSSTVEITSNPIFSVDGGFYSGSQSVSFINASEADIYYSLDGTPPNNSSTLYTGPIIINETTPIRAIAYQTGKPPSDIVTNTFFIDIPVNLPVISIVTDPDNFFDDEIGIYVTGVNGRGGYCAGVVGNMNQDWERPVNLELYEIDGDQGLNQRAGVKIFGGCSRHRFPQKSLSLFARGDYGKGSFSYKLFEEKDIDKFESFVLRSSADDQIFTMFRDAAAQQLMVETMDADYQAYQPVVVYLNGDYWGIHNIREKLNEHYLAGNFGVDPGDINILAGDGSSWNTSHGSNADYISMINFVTRNSMTMENNYEQVKDMMDADQYIEYMIGHIYMSELDWPHGNIKYWKANSGEYSRWRWINYDLDGSLLYEFLTENMIHKTTTTDGPSWPNPEWSTRLFRNLLENMEFRNRFINKYSWHISTTFDSTRAISIIDKLADRIRPEIPYHIEKWGGMVDPVGAAAEDWITPTFDSVELWESYVDTMRIFLRERQQYTVQNIVNHFELSGASHVNVNMNLKGSGVIKILDNKIPDEFSGIFFNDVPVQLSAAPILGYKFSHWEAASVNGSLIYETPDIEHTFTEDITLTAHFDTASIQNEKLVVISEINYKSHTEHNTEDWIEIYNNSGTVIDMSNWKFVDTVNDMFLFPDGYLFLQDEYLVLCEDTDMFKEKNPLVTNLLGNFDLGLSSSGELIRIVNGENAIIDEVEYKIENPWPITANGTGYTIELTDLTADNNVGENWTAANLYGTPGKVYSIVNSLSGDGINNQLKYALYRNYPNPFNPSTTIHFSLNQSGPVVVNIYNLLGQHIQTLIDQHMEMGEHQIIWDGKNETNKIVSSGIYIVTLKMADNALLSRPILLMK